MLRTSLLMLPWLSLASLAACSATGSSSSSSGSSSSGIDILGPTGGDSSVATSSSTGSSGGDHDPLVVGKWLNVQQGIELQYEFAADGKLDFSIVHIQGTTCTGSVDVASFTWSTAGTTLSTAGTSTCSGMLTCANGGHADCSMLTGVDGTSACQYALTNGDATLTLGPCSKGGEVTMERLK